MKEIEGHMADLSGRRLDQGIRKLEARLIAGYCWFLVVFSISLAVGYLLLLFKLLPGVAEHILAVDLKVIRAGKDYWVAGIVLAAPLFIREVRRLIARLKRFGGAEFYEEPREVSEPARPVKMRNAEEETKE